MSDRNRQIWLQSYSKGVPTAENFEIREVPLPCLGEGEFLVRNILLSADPTARAWASGDTASKRVELGQTMPGFAVGEIVESRNPAYLPGDRVMGFFGWQDYAAANDAQVMRRVAESNLPLSTSLGILGLTGLTAYFGLLEICRPKPGETVIVTSAAGAVGSTAAQIAKIKGCRVVGVAGGQAKVARCLEDFSLDAAIDYKAEFDLDASLRTSCPDGVDCFFDNTSGPVHDAVLRHINMYARIAICGTAAYASWAPWNNGPRPERHLLLKRAIMQGFTTMAFAHRYDEAITDLTAWISEGRLKYREHILEGINGALSSIQLLYSGENDGKVIIKL